MKKPVIIGVSALTLLTLGATLFAQTTTGSSLITQMKAATHAFTLSADLNSGATGLESAPLVGKRTGDQLSAAEYNRLLELVSQGGGGSGGSGWVDVPLTDTADFDGKCDYIFNGLRATFVHPEIIGFVKNEFDATSAASWYAVRKENKNTMIRHQDNYANNTIYPNQPITSITKNCGGGGGGTGGGGFNWDACTPEWVGTPKNGTPYTNAAGLKCKYTGASGPGALDSTYYLCCPGS